MIFSLATHCFYDIDKAKLEDIRFNIDLHRAKFEEYYPKQFVKIVFTLILSQYSEEDLVKIRKEIEEMPC